jgi:protoheme ferro-lyase
MPRKKITSVGKANKGEYYVAPKDLNEEFKKYFESSNNPDERVISEKLGKMIWNIANHYATKSCFNGYTYKDEFISDGVYKMLQQMHRIDLTHPKCNPFSYLTCICYCAFVNKIKKTEAHNKKLKAIQEQIFEDFCRQEGIVNPKYDSITDSDDITPEMISEMIDEVEESDK